MEDKNVVLHITSDDRKLDLNCKNLNLVVGLQGSDKQSQFCLSIRDNPNGYQMCITNNWGEVWYRGPIPASRAEFIEAFGNVVAEQLKLEK